ncbi:MAG: GGDEF domain-containing protein [Thiohalobacteraceae bacterium]
MSFEIATDMTAVKSATATAEMLAQLPLFEGEQPEALIWLAPLCHVEQLARDSVLLDPRRSEDRAFIILDGEVQVRLGRREGQVLATLGIGQCVGEMSVIECVPPSAMVTTRTACQVLVLEGRVLRSLLEVSNVVPRNLLRMLARRVRKDNVILRHSLEQQAVSAQRARLDSLTGLFNRRWLDEALPELVVRHRLQRQQLALLMIDIDRFKSFNDTYGHLAGDQVLTGVAHALQQDIRGGDQAARFGGEEFVIVLPNTPIVEAGRIATRLRCTIKDTAFSSPEGAPLPGVTVSIGLAESTPDESAEALLARADAALYQAKQQGRDRLVISDGVGDRATDGTLVARLRREPPRD